MMRNQLHNYPIPSHQRMSGSDAGDIGHVKLVNTN